MTEVVSDTNAAGTEENAADIIAAAWDAESGAPQAPDAFDRTAPEAPIAPVKPDLTGLSDEAANKKIRAYNEQVRQYNEAAEKYNSELENYLAAADEYNASVDSFNNEVESYNTKVNEHNKGEQEKQDAYNAAMEDYNKKAETYNNYQAKIDAVSERNLAKAETQMETLGDIKRADKESILSLGTVLEEDYTVKYGYRTVTLGHEGDLVISWADLTPGETHSTIQVENGEKSGNTYKVANLHIFEDFTNLSEMSDYQSENGWDSLNINVDDENGVIIIPKALIDRIAMIEIDVAEVDANDTVTVMGQNSLFQSNYVTVAGRFFEGYTDGPYWYTASTVFESNASTTESDWTGTGHTFTYADGTSDRAEIKNPLNVNHYVFARYTNPYTLPEKPEEVSTSMMDLANLIDRVEAFGAKLSSLLGLTEREIETNDDPTPTPAPAPTPAPVPTPVPAPDPFPYIPIVPAVPAEEEIPDERTPHAEPEDDEDPSQVPVSVSTAAEKSDEELSTLVHYEFEDISDAEVPMASGASWALLNLILSVLTVLLALVSLLRRRETEDGEKETRLNLSVVIPAAASVILFILTEDMRNPMVFTDVWTPLMLFLLIANCILGLLSARAEEKAEAEA